MRHRLHLALLSLAVGLFPLCLLSGCGSSATNSEPALAVDAPSDPAADSASDAAYEAEQKNQ